jgi:hypothetical protein
MLMQALYGESLPFGTPIRYRIAVVGRWQAGEAVEFERAELTFLCDAPLELHAAVEVVLPTKVQVMGRESPLNLLCSGTVVSRVLANWPELRSALVVGIRACQIAPVEAFAAAKATGTEGNRR